MIDVDVALDRGDFSLDVAFTAGARVTGLFGHSGSGKTTLLHVLSGLVRPDRGRILLDGEPLLDADRGIHVPPHRRRIGVVFQEARLFPHLSVDANLRYGMRGPDAPDHDGVVELLDLEPLLERRPHGLSGGEHQRVAIGRALLRGPRLLLLDEPLASLDRPRRRRILPFLKRIRDELGIPAVYVSHELEEILQLTDELVLLDGGRVAGRGRYLDLALDGAHLLAATPLVNVLELDVLAAGPELTALRLPSAPPSPHPELAGPGSAFLPGRRVSVAIRPEDVALARDSVEGVSIRNQLPGTVTRIVPHGGDLLVQIDAGVPLLACVTGAAVAELALEPGASVWGLIKAGAVRYLES